jgi:hypothetical protein
MRLLGLLISYLSRICARVGGLAYEIATFLNNILPALLSADELTRLIRVHYEGMYGHAAAQYSAEVLEWGLEPWEEEVVVQHKIVSGATMVLGAGVGRESIALAQRGLGVIGLDINHAALRLAQHCLSRSTWLLSKPAFWPFQSFPDRWTICFSPASCTAPFPAARHATRHGTIAPPQESRSEWNRPASRPEYSAPDEVLSFPRYAIPTAPADSHG